MSRRKGQPANEYNVPFREGVDPLISALHMRRLDLGLTQGAVAKQMGTHASVISLLENGRGNPSLFTLRLWADVLSMDVRVTKIE